MLPDMRFLPLSLILTAMLITSACDGTEVRDAVGLTRTAPDEFVVVSRPPLSVPPDFELRPPRPGETRTDESTERQARNLILKGDPNSATTIDELVPASDKVNTAVDPVITTDAKTAAESTFLGKLGAEKADPDIRKKLGADVTTPKDTADSKSLYEKLIKEEGAEPVVDAKKEATRIRDNKEKGKPINKGKVPEVDPNTSVIDRLF